MDSREEKRAAIHEKFQQLRSVTNSSAINKTLIIMDAFKNIHELKKKIERLDQDIIGTSQTSSMVMVERVRRGFRINVFLEKKCPGLLVFILEAFEEMGLDVLDARVSCSDNFRLEAVGENEGQVDSINAQMVKQALLQAIKKCEESEQE